MANELYFSRGMFVLTWILILFFLMVERYGFFKFYTYLNSLGIGETVVIIYGTGVPARQLIARFSQSPKLGYYVAGFIEDDPVEKTILGLPVLGSFENLKEIIQKAGAEKLFIALGQVSSERVIKILNVCRETGCKFQVIPTLYETALERVRMTDVEGIPLIGFQEPKPSLRTVAAKRLFDFFIGLFLLIVLFFPAALVAGIIRIIYRRQVFSQMICIGKKGRHFNCYSFAIAEPEKDFSEEPEKTSKEKRSLLEMTGFYRYPQLLNVVKGDMSLVGPQPESPDSHSPDKNYKLNVRPGITGLWDFTSRKQSLPYQERNLDIYYIQNQSIFLDVIIIIRRFFLFF
jgi:lipopolysaccharide/colanic/teichoic acid biosynthesis glycosyltransferase